MGGRLGEVEGEARGSHWLSKQHILIPLVGGGLLKGDLGLDGDPSCVGACASRQGALELRQGADVAGSSVCPGLTVRAAGT